MTRHDGIRGFLRTAAAGAAATLGLLAIPAGAQASYQYDDIREVEASSSGRFQDQAKLRLVPQGWVAIGYDITGDGELDAYELIQAYDLEQARSQSARRRENDQRLSQMLDDPRFMGDRFGQDLQRFRQDQRITRRFEEDFAPEQRSVAKRVKEDTYEVSGFIERLSTVRMEDADEPSLIATVSGEAGRTAVVDLGPLSQVRWLRLNEGDRIEALAKLGSLDGKTVLEAEKVRARGQMISVDRMGRDAYHLQGTVQSLRTGMRRGSDDRHLLALVRLADGTRTTVDLGPVHKLSPEDIRIGQRLSFVAKPAHVAGQQGLVAKQVLLDGQLVDVRSERRSLAGGRFGGVREASAPRFGDQRVLPVQIQAYGHRFDPSYIVATPGQQIRLNLRNTGTDPHAIAFEMPNAYQASMDRVLYPGDADTVTFEAPEQPGTYTFYCPVGNHREMGMEGRLIVRSAGD